MVQLDPMIAGLGHRSKFTVGGRKTFLFRLPHIASWCESGESTEEAEVTGTGRNESENREAGMRLTERNR